MLSFEYIQNKIVKNNKNAIKVLTDEEKDFLLNQYEAPTIQECIWMCKNNISESDVPRCEICGARTRWLGGHLKHNRFYSLTCQNKDCQNKLRKQRLEKATLDKYGVSNYGYTQKKEPQPKRIKTQEEIAEINQLRIKHMQDTMFQKYGVTNAQQIPEVKEKTNMIIIERYGGVGNASDRLRKKQQLALIEKYGVDNAMKSDEIKNRMIENNLQKYGVNWSFARDDVKEKIIQTCIIKHGVKHYNNPEAIKQTMKEIYGCEGNFGRECVKEKIFDVCIKKYNNGEYGETEEEIKDFLLKNSITSISQLPGVITKIQETKRKNGTFNTSKPEENTYELLCEKFSKDDVERQYKSNLYPYNCDFYIKSLDLYIECNFSWTHCGHFYNEDLDKEKLQAWIEKDTDFYRTAIKTWTVRDVAKLNTALKNNLNYKVFWNINEVKEWLASV